MKEGVVVNVKVKSFANNELFEDVEKKVIVGRGFLLKGLDDALLSHNVGDEFVVELDVNNAYGPRQRGLIKMIPFKFFVSNKINPVRGLLVNIDGLLGKIISVGAGRVMVDFNHPLAGKDLRFEVKITGLVSDLNELVSVVVNSVIGEGVKAELVDGVLNLSVKELPKSVEDKLVDELNIVVGKDKVKSIKYLSND